MSTKRPELPPNLWVPHRVLLTLPVTVVFAECSVFQTLFKQTCDHERDKNIKNWRLAVTASTQNLLRSRDMMT